MGNLSVGTEVHVYGTARIGGCSRSSCFFFSEQGSNSSVCLLSLLTLVSGMLKQKKVPMSAEPTPTCPREKTFPFYREKSNFLLRIDYKLFVMLNCKITPEQSCPLTVLKRFFKPNLEKKPEQSRKYSVLSENKCSCASWKQLTVDPLFCHDFRTTNQRS